MSTRHNAMSFRSLRPFLVAALLLPGLALAQTPKRIEQQMTPEQFKAAGLDQLTPAQLGNLNGWLNNTLDVETTRAAANAKKKVEDDNRGFLSFGTTDPIAARINGEFRGFAQGRSWTLDNGQVWRQVDEASLVGVRKTDPSVKINPSLVGNAWYMAIEGYNTRAKVERIK